MSLNTLEVTAVTQNNKHIGGLALVEKMGPDYMREIGRRGGLFTGPGKGRPRALPIEEITPSRVPAGIDSNFKKEDGSVAQSRDALLALWRSKAKAEGF